MHDCDERGWVVHPGEVPGSRQQGHVGVAKMGGQPADSRARRPDVEPTRHQQHWRGQRREPPGQRGVRLEARVEPVRSRLGELSGLGGCLRLCPGVPSPVQQRRRQPPAPLQFLRRCSLGGQGGDCVGVPRFVGSSGQHVVYAEVGREADDPKGRLDQHKMIDPMRVLSRVQQADPAAG